MPYDTALADRIRDLLTDTPGLVEKKMFGGIGWTINGHMACGAHNDARLIIRCSKEAFPGLLEEPGAGGMMRGGKAMAGWNLVDNEAVIVDEALELWVGRGRDYAAGLPPKQK